MIEQSSVYTHLKSTYSQANLFRPMRMNRYEQGTELVLKVTGLVKKHKGAVRLVIEKFVGGGFAGQVYRVKILSIETGEVEGLKAGKICAMKILIPPSGGSLFFRNFLYGLGFQAPFQLQVNPAAARAGAIWQKFFRRGAKICFGDERAVVDIYATFVDDGLGSCGELSEWIEGRTWRLEVDDRLDLLSKWKKGKKVDESALGSPEYRAKWQFMKKFVELLHDMGGYEFARQYEWSTWKSQPNCLKRLDSEDHPEQGLTAVDFRAGLALLCFLPMSPGDFKLILQGFCRGNLVQFDRGDIGKLEEFIKKQEHEFSDLIPLIGELRSNEEIYRFSVLDITHHFFRFFSPRLWSTFLDSSITGWKVRNYLDKSSLKKIQKSRFKTWMFLLLGLIPFLGKTFRRMWGHSDWRKHYGKVWTSVSYFRRTIQGKAAEKLIKWYREERFTEEQILALSSRPWKVMAHAPLSIFPVSLQKCFTDFGFLRERLAYYTIRPVRLYFNRELREQWMMDMVAEGKKNNLITQQDADEISSQLKEPFIQKYLKCLAVHVCTLPVTQVVSITVALIYVALHSDMPREKAWAIGLGIIVIFQVLPLSPGSLVRGAYVLYLVIKERNFKDYNIAVFLGFFKYVGYLAFPIQMAQRYPTIARFMSSHWATSAVHIVPVFGESGALLEQKIYSLFYNWPLTLRRRLQKKAEFRAKLEKRYWHIIACAILGSLVFGLIDLAFLTRHGILPELSQIWLATVLVPLILGAVISLWAGGAPFGMRVVGGAICGASVGILYTLTAFAMSMGNIPVGNIVVSGLWKFFIFTLLTASGALFTELKIPEPE